MPIRMTDDHSMRSAEKTVIKLTSSEKSFYFLCEILRVVRFFTPVFLGICLPEWKEQLNLGLFANLQTRNIDSVNGNEKRSPFHENDRV